MRKIVAFDRVSADGYFADADGGLSWTVPEPALDRAAVDGMTGPATLLFGRRTYDMFESFWPNVAAAATGSAPDPHAPGRASPELRAMATWIDDATKIVFSRTRPDVTWRNSRLARDIVPEEIDALKRGPGGDIMVFGSGSVVSRLTALGLVDEYRLVVGPLLLGAGAQLVRGIATAPVRLELVEATPYPSGNVVLHYRRAG